MNSEIVQNKIVNDHLKFILTENLKSKIRNPILSIILHSAFPAYIYRLKREDMNKRWAVREQADFTAAEKLAAELNIDAVLSSLLLHRGITNFDEAKLFFRPDERHLHDPFLMADMETAVLRIEAAIAGGERVLIFGDYDVDGTTAVSLVYSFFKKYCNNLAYYIPDRYTEGYGISTRGIDYAAENDFKLVIALDCGIKSVDKICLCQ